MNNFGNFSGQKNENLSSNPGTDRKRDNMSNYSIADGLVSMQ